MQDPENFQKEKLTIDLVWANVFGIIILIPILLFFGAPYYLIWTPELDFAHIKDKITGEHLLIFFAVMFLGIIIHELIHGITWARFAKNSFKSIKFGVLWKMLTPYCHCKEPLKVTHYMIGAIAPGFIMGFLPTIAALIFGNPFVLIFGMFFTMTAAGDILVINLIRKENHSNFVLDHPSEAGCYIYRPNKPVDNHNKMD